jgi:NADH-quinone oxidoreductase subunit A
VTEFHLSYLTVVIFGLAAGALMAVSLGLGRVLRPNNPNKQKLTTYESGVDPVGATFNQSQVRYYIFALLFVMFDVEAVFIFPWAIGLERYGAYGLGAMGLFIFVLTLPLLYAWRKGVLKWV